MDNANQRTADSKQAQVIAKRCNRKLVVVFDPENKAGWKWVGDHGPYIIATQGVAESRMKGCEIVYRTS